MALKYPQIWAKLDPLWSSFADRDQVEALWQLYELSLESLNTHLVQVHQNKNIQTVQPFHVARHLHIEIADHPTAGDTGIIQTYPYCYKFAGESANVVYIKALQDSYNNPITYLEFSVDFVVFAGHIYFKEIPPLRRFYAPICYKDIQTLYNNYGALIGYKKSSSSYSYLYDLQALWYAVWRAPTPAILTNALTVILGAPFAEVATTVTKITQYKIHLASGRILNIPPGSIPIVYAGQKVYRFQALTNSVVLSDHVNAPFWWRSRNDPANIAPDNYFGEDGLTADINDLSPSQMEDALRRFHVFNVEIHLDIDMATSTKLQVMQVWLRRLKPTYVDYLIRVNLSFSNIYDQDSTTDPDGDDDEDEDVPGGGGTNEPGGEGPGGGGGEIVVPPGEVVPPVTPGGASIFDRVPIIDYSLEFSASTIDWEEKYFRFCTGVAYFYTNLHPDSGTWSYTNWLRREYITETILISPEYSYDILLSAGWVEYGVVEGSYITNSNLITNGPATVTSETITVPDTIIPGGGYTTYAFDITPASTVFTNNAATVTNDNLGYSVAVTETEHILPDHIIPGYSTTTYQTVATGPGTNLGAMEVIATHAPVYETITVPSVSEDITVLQFVPETSKLICDMRLERIDSYWIDTAIMLYYEDAYICPTVHNFGYSNTFGVASLTNSELLTNATLYIRGGLFATDELAGDDPDFFEYAIVDDGWRIITGYIEEFLSDYGYGYDLFVEPRYLDFSGTSCITNHSDCVTNGRKPVWIDVPVKISDDVFETRSWVVSVFEPGILTNLNFETNSISLTNTPAAVENIIESETIQTGWETWSTVKELEWVDASMCMTAHFYCRNIEREDFLQIFEFEPGGVGSDLFDETKYLRWCDPYAGVTNPAPGNPVITNRYTLDYTEEIITIVPDSYAYELVSAGYVVYAPTTGSLTTNDTMFTNTGTTNTGSLEIVETVPAVYNEVLVPGIFETIITPVPLEDVGGRTPMMLNCTVLENFSDLIFVSDPAMGLSDERFYVGAKESCPFLVTNDPWRLTNQSCGTWDSDVSFIGYDTLIDGGLDYVVAQQVESAENLFAAQSYFETSDEDYLNADNYWLYTNDETVTNEHKLHAEDLLFRFLVTNPPEEELGVETLSAIDGEVYSAATDYRYGFNFLTNCSDTWLTETVEVSPAYDEDILVSPSWAEYSQIPGGYFTNDNLVTNGAGRIVTQLPDTVIPGDSYFVDEYVVTPAATFYTNSAAHLSNTLLGYHCSIVQVEYQYPDTVVTGELNITLGEPIPGAITNNGAFNVTQHPAEYNTVHHPAVTVTLQTFTGFCRTNNIYAKTNASFSNLEDFTDSYLGGIDIYDEEPGQLGLYQDQPTEILFGAGFDDAPDAEISGGEFDDIPTDTVDGGSFPNESWSDEIYYS